MACQFDLEAALPGETDDVGRFQKLELLLEGHRGVIDVHLRRDGGAPEICVHHDPAVLPLDQLQALVRSTGSAVSDRYRMHTWLVADMDAPQCAQVIEHALSRMAGVLSASVAYASERLVVEYDSRAVKPAQIEERVRAVGYALSEPEKAHTCIYHGAGGLSPKWRVPLSVAAAVLIAAGLLSEHVLHLPPLVAIGCFAGAIVTGGLFAMRGALQALRQGRVDIESLMVLAAVGAAVLGAWFEGAFLLLLFSVGHALEHRAMDRARKSLESLARLRPQVARVRRGQAVVEVKVEELKRGDRIVVRPGDRIPLDGVVREGETHVDQAAVTGESIPVPKRAGDEVYAATVNSDGAIEVEVTRLSSESLLSRVIKMVAQAEAQKSPTQRFAARLEKRFVPLVLVAAALTPVVFHLLGYELKEAVLRGVALLVAASPCALAISTPAAVLSAVAAAARGGVLVKGGAHLEELGRVKVVAFDKTGTLTEGRPRVVSVVPSAGESRDHVMAVAAAAESLSAHPLARAVVEAARAQGIAPLSASGLEAVHGKGLRAQVAGQPVAIGSLALFGEGVPEALRAEVERLEGAGQTTMVVHHADRYLGVVGLQDTLRGDAQKTVAALRSLGIGRCLMLSGDNARVAKALAAELGLDEVRAPLLPDGKVRELRALARDEGVAMVGDGVNDAPALAAASVGIAMGGAGADAALETADVVLMSDQLHRLPFALGLARKASSVVRQNLVISLGVSAALVVASLVGLAQVSHAVVLHEGSTLLVVANGLRLLGYRHDS